MRLENMRRQTFGGYRREDVLAYLAELAGEYTRQLGRLQEELHIQKALVKELSRENERLHLSNLREEREQEREEYHAAL